jgi:cytidine deaminase
MIPPEHVEALPLWIRDTLGITCGVSDQQYEYLSRLKQLAEHLILRAYKASTYSVSYRPFAVGSALVGISSHSLSAMRVYTGNNMKVHKDARVNCGEAAAIIAALQGGCWHIPLIAVVGTPQEDHGSGRTYPTLHPCFRCRGEFCRLKVITDQTIIITATFNAARTLQEEADAIFGQHVEQHDEKTGFTYYEPLEITETQQPSIWLDDLIALGHAEAMSLPQLLARHATD